MTDMKPLHLADSETYLRYGINLLSYKYSKNSFCRPQPKPQVMMETQMCVASVSGGLSTPGIVSDMKEMFIDCTTGGLQLIETFSIQVETPPIPLQLQIQTRTRQSQGHHCSHQCPRLCLHLWHPQEDPHHS